MPGKKSRVRRAAEDHVRTNMAIKALQGKPISSAAKEMGITPASAYRVWNDPQTTSLVEAVTARRREDLTTLFDRTVDSLLVDTEALAQEGSTLYERQSIRAEVWKVINLCDPSKNKQEPQTPQSSGVHVTMQTLIQLINGTSQLNTSNGPSASPEVSTATSPRLLP